MLKMPGTSHAGPLPPLSPIEHEINENVTGHLHVLATEIGERNLSRYESLNAAADYIENELVELGYGPERQTFAVSDYPVRNLEAELAGRDRPEEILVVGGHYDTVFGCPGANGFERRPQEALRMTQLEMIHAGDWRARTGYWASYFLIGRN